MKPDRFWVSVAVVFVCGLLIDAVFFVKVYLPMMESSFVLWRTPEEIPWPLVFVAYALFSYMFCLIFAKGYEGKGPIEGIRYGLMMALFLIPFYLGWFALQPLHPDLVLWMSTETFLGLPLLGWLAAVIQKPR